MIMLPEVKRRMEEVQVVNLKLTDEVEKLENMLKLQSGINRGNYMHNYHNCNYMNDKIYSLIVFSNIYGNLITIQTCTEN
jgi:hypothetical protein